MSASPACFVCGGTTGPSRTAPYRRCASCGHEVLVEGRGQTHIVNDHLDERSVRRPSRLDRFQSAVLARFDAACDRAQLVDIGSASGRFLLHNAPRYARATGVEVTPTSIRFSREVLGLHVVEDLRQVDGAVSVATAWHSLEHVPTEALLDLLAALAAKMARGARFIVSVPNADSRQYVWFGDGYAFFDVPNHHHQFTPGSLARLLGRFGFTRVADAASTPYNSFGYTQGLLNACTPGHNYLYYRLKRRSARPALHLDALNAALLPLAVPAGWLLGALDRASLDRQGVITACFERHGS